jgi:hypothetical protein
MKVIDNLKNTMNKEVQHFVESQLSEVMKMKMLPIQFVSILNQIQMCLMKVIDNFSNMMNQEFQEKKEL